MSTLQEHVGRLRPLREKARMGEPYGPEQMAYQSEVFLTLHAHLEEVALLVAGRDSMPKCQAHLIAGLWQCEHCGHFDTAEPRCTHLGAGGAEPKPASVDQASAPVALPDAAGQGSPWIAVSERLPDDAQAVFAAYWPYNNKSNQQSIQLCIFEAHSGNFLTYTDGDESHPPSHWMPAPELPTLPALPAAPK